MSGLRAAGDSEIDGIFDNNTTHKLSYAKFVASQVGRIKYSGRY
jgi:hypothetical protein